MDDKLLVARRSALKGLIKTYAKKRYDARPILDGFINLTNLLRERGHTYRPPIPVLTTKYWEEESNRSNQHLNRNPITGVDRNTWKVIRGVPAPPEENLIKGYPFISGNKRKSLDFCNYYNIMICWDGDISPDIQDKINQVFSEMGIPQGNSDNNGKLIYRFEGTEDGYRMLKRSVSVMIDILSGCSFNIGVVGKKIN